MDKLTTTAGFSLPEIEQGALSCLCQWPEQSFKLADSFGIKVEHFQTPENRTLFGAVEHYYREGNPLDLIAFTQKLRDLSLLDQIGGPSYITETWCNTCYSPDSFEYYLSLIEEAHAKRVLAITCGDTLREAKEPGAEGEPLIRETIESLSQIPLPGRHVRIDRSIGEEIDDKVARIISGESDKDIIKTGLIDLDRMSPMRKGDMPLIAGERKAGKSILALNVALNVAAAGIPVLLFSLEDREPKLIERILGAISRVSVWSGRSRYNPEDIEALQAAKEKIRALPLYVKDDIFDLPKLVSTARQYKARKNIGLIVTDYGQLVTIQDKKGDTNREQCVAEVSRTLRLLSMELDTPNIVLSQLNENNRTRESRALEQDATAMWRVDLVEDKPNMRSIVIPWQRNGPSGVGFKVAFIGEQARVESIARDEFGDQDA